MAERTILISWANDRGMTGHDVPVTETTADAVNVIAMRMAVMHFDIMHPKKGSNIYGMGAAIATHLPQTDPALWERFKGAAINSITALHGSGEKDLAHSGRKDSRQYFEALHDFAGVLRNG